MYPTSLLTHNWLIKELVNTKVRQRLPSLSGCVVDLGCGVRPFDQDIKAHATHYFGVDWQQSLHASRPDLIADLNRVLPLRDACADHVVSFEVLEHLAEPGVMLAEAHRILRPGGQLTLSVPFQWWTHEAPWDYQRYTQYGLAYQLRKAGFTDIVVEPTSGFWSMWILKLNYQLARLVRGPKVVRMAMRACLIPVWCLGQLLAPRLDAVWFEDRESAGFFVVATKS